MEENSIYRIEINDEPVVNCDSDEVLYTSKEKAIKAIKEFCDAEGLVIYSNSDDYEDSSIKAINPDSDYTYRFDIYCQDEDERINPDHSVWDVSII